MTKIKNSLEKPSFGKDTEILFDSSKVGVDPNNERIIVDAKTVLDQKGNEEKWIVIRRLDSVRIIAEKDGEIYFAKQRQGDGKPYYSIFGGSVISGEDHETAAKRELLEESGFKGDMELLMHWNNPDGRLKWAWSIWIAHNIEKIAEQNLDKSEEIEVVKVKNFDEFMKVITNEHPMTKDVAFKDKNFLTIINNYKPVNPVAVKAISEKIHSR